MKKNIIFLSNSFYPAVSYGGPIFSILGVIESVKSSFSIQVLTTDCNNGSILTKDEICQAKSDFSFPIIYFRSSFFLNNFSLELCLAVVNRLMSEKNFYSQGFFNINTLILSVSSLFIKDLNVVIAPRGSLGQWSLQQKSWKKKLFLKFFINSKRFVFHVTSDQELADLKKLGFVNKAIVIGNFDNVSRPEGTYPSFRMHDRERVFCSVGRHDKQKGFDSLISDWRSCRLGEKGFTLAIIGPFSQYTKTLRSLAGDDESVQFIELVNKSELITWYRSCAGVISASRYENFGNTVFEALREGASVLVPKHLHWQKSKFVDFLYFYEGSIPFEYFLDSATRRSTEDRVRQINLCEQVIGETMLEYQKSFSDVFV